MTSTNIENITFHPGEFPGGPRFPEPEEEHRGYPESGSRLGTVWLGGWKQNENGSSFIGIRQDP